MSDDPLHPMPRDQGTPRGADPIRVAIVEDHPLVREGLRSVFEPLDDIELAGEATTAGDALVMFENDRFDVILLDVRLPDADGLTLLRELRARDPSARVVMLTCFSDPRCVRSAIDSGACGFLTKSSADPTVLIETVRSASHGVSAVSPEALTSLLENVRDHTREHLTEREAEVWRLMAQGRTNAEIATILFLSERTVKFHVGNVLRKTGSRSRAEAVSRAFTSGLMGEEPA